MPAMTHEHLVLYGKLDYWIPREHIDEMARTLPNSGLEVFPYVGHSMNLEVPLLFARVFSDYFRNGLNLKSALLNQFTHQTTATEEPCL